MADHRSKVESSPAGLGAAERFSGGTSGASFRKRGSAARAVGSFVPRLTQKAMQKFGFSTAALFTDWPTIVGADLAKYTTPLRLKWPRAADTYGETAAEESGRSCATLHLQVNASRALDIQYKGAQIIERINAYFGYRAVADLRLFQAPIAPEPRQPMPRDIVAVKGPRASKPLADLSKIEDEELRAAFELMQQAIAARR